VCGKKSSGLLGHLTHGDLICTSATFLCLITLAACAAAEIPPEALKQYLQGEDFYVRGQAEAALAIFTRVAEQHPGFHQASFMRGKSLYLLNRPAEAKKVLQDLARRAPRYHEAQIWLARVELQQGETDSAEKLLAELLSYDSQDSRLLYLMARVKTDQGRIQDAITLLERAVATEEDLARAHIDLGRLYFRFGLDDKARAELSRALLLLPATSPILNPVRDLLSQIGKKE
jgi:tetratricopeptide (TPR) repeat protein